jgi:uncharacterized damage-inducible protein DinB
MNAKDAIRVALQMNHHVLQTYLSDLSDADLLVRPVPAANHLAWQLGHLISAEAHFLTQIPGATPPELPAGFDKQHSKETAGSDTTTGFRKKQDYLNLFEKVRGSTLAALDRIPDAQLDNPTTGPMAKFFPTVGSLFLLVANHELMHAGQVAVLRRKLGKPILI